MKKKLISVIGVLALIAAVLTGCSSKNAGNESEAAGEDSVSAESAQTIKVAFSNSYPNTYFDEDGNATGYEVEVMKLVDERLQDYRFEYVNVDGSSALYTGLSTGKYDIALGNLFYTVERGEEYNVPENQIGSSPMGIYRSVKYADIDTLDKVAESNIRFQPFNHGNGLTRVIEEYNEQHPDEPIEFDYTDNYGGFAEYVQWVVDDRIDAGITQMFSWNAEVEAEDGAFHDLKDQLAYDVVITVPTYPLINKSQTDLAEQVNEVLGQLKEEGKLVEISEQFFGLNVFDY